jgi:hypothetical protein
MPPTSRSSRLVQRAEAALIAAIEVYNKPRFAYREETFSILALNAWELLLKAKLVLDNKNHPRCIYVYERRQTKKGGLSKKLYTRKNRSGHFHTISLGQAIVELDKKTATRLSPALKSNLDALIAIRDSAVHYIEAGPLLAKRVLEIGTASVKNFIEIGKRWFSIDLSTEHFFLMPIGFLSAPGNATAISVSNDERTLVAYLSQLVGNAQNEPAADFHVALEVNLSFKRAPTDAVARVRVTNDPNDPAVTLTEEDIRNRYRWDYEELTAELRGRYMDFVANQTYHDLRKPLMSDRRYARPRYLEPGNPRSAKKDFYNPHILTEFDKHYTRKSQH